MCDSSGQLYLVQLLADAKYGVQVHWLAFLRLPATAYSPQKVTSDYATRE